VLSQAIKSQISPDSERNKTSARSEDRWNSGIGKR